MPLIQPGRSFRIMGYDIPEYRSEPDGPYKLKPSGTVLGIEHAHNRGHAMKISAGVLQLRQLRAQVFPAVNAQINKCIAL